MFSARSAFALLLVPLWLAACSEGDSSGRVILRADDDGVIFSPADLAGSIEYLPTMKPEQVRIVGVDKDLNPVDSFVATVSVDYRDNYVFYAESHEYEYPLIKVVTSFLSENGRDTMTFAQYARISGDRGHLRQNLFAALAADRIETLVKKKRYTFADAEALALWELGEVFGLDLSGINGQEYAGCNPVYVDQSNLRGYAPYIYCRHEISDSVFYHDFKKFRKEFAKLGKVDSSWIVKAADAWLSTFENVFQDDVSTLYQSMSRDALAGIRCTDYVFFERAYGIKFGWSAGDTSSPKVMNKSSAYYGRSFVMDNSWRLKSSLEDTLGLCLYDKDTTVLNDGDYYRCRNSSNVWKRESDHDSVLVYTIGKCDQYYTKNRGAYVGDSLYVCLCDDVSCGWSDRYATRKWTESDSLYSVVIDARAAKVFGKCKSNYYRSGEMKQLDSALFVQCSLEQWILIDSLHYYLGNCISGHDKGKHLGIYYGCKEYGWDNDWIEIPAPQYYGDTCSDDRYYNRVVQYDGDYFICKPDYCQDEDGFVNHFCSFDGFWRKLDSAEIIPPVINMDTCDRPQVNQKVSYDGIIYECQAGDWHRVHPDSLLAPEKDGLICRDSLFGVIRNYGVNYFSCDTTRKWRELTTREAAPYKYRDSLGTCETITEKTLYWDMWSSGLYGCVRDSAGMTWQQVMLAPGPNYTMPRSYDRKKFAGGMMKDDSTYRVTVDGVVYEFGVYGADWFLKHVDISGRGYDAYFYKGNLFLHSERGEERRPLHTVENRSDSFDSFFADWKAWAKECSVCQSRRADVDTTVDLLLFNEDAYMDWTRASVFCPEGFHVPTRDEFEQNDYISYVTTNLDIRNDAPVVWNYTMHRSGCYESNSLYFDLFWTSTEKDSEMQYCFEVAWHPHQNEKGRRIVECPKDLYPMVQVLCVKDD